ncbi:MAG: calcium-binding protein [Altererythrobacter sp.]
MASNFVANTGGSGSSSTSTTAASTQVFFGNSGASGQVSGSGSVATPAPGKSVTVSSVEALRAAIADTSIDTILVAPGSYTVAQHDTAYHWGQAGIYIDRPVTIATATPGSRADFHIGFEVSKGIFVVGPHGDVTFDGIGFFDTANFSPYKNYAGIRAEGGDVTVLNSHFENNLNGILGGEYYGENGRLVIRQSTFVRNGSTDGDGNEHQIYWTGDAVHVEDSQFTDSGYGHSIKTLTKYSTTVVDNTIVDGRNGAPPIDVTGGGDLLVSGNHITKQTESKNGLVIRYDTIRHDGVAGDVLVEGNTFVSTSNPYGYPTTVLINNLSGSTAVVRDNVLEGNFRENLFWGDVTLAGNTINGAITGDFSWRANADDLTASGDVLFMSGSSGKWAGAVLKATDAGNGNDIVVASPDYKGSDVIFGGNGNDVLVGGRGDDYLYGEAGDDVLFANGAGSIYVMDNLHGGEGNDFLTVGPVAAGDKVQVYFDGGAGNDILDARTADYFVLVGEDGNDILIGSRVSTDNDTGLNGGAGDDIVYGGTGRAKHLFGGDGIDTLVYDAAYNVDLKVEAGYGHHWISALTGQGQIEVSQYGEEVHSFEFIQFSNGVYVTGSDTFVEGEVRVDLAELLATPLPAYPQDGLASSPPRPDGFEKVAAPTNDPSLAAAPVETDPKPQTTVFGTQDSTGTSAWSGGSTGTGFVDASESSDETGNGFATTPGTGLALFGTQSSPSLAQGFALSTWSGFRADPTPSPQEDSNAFVANGDAEKPAGAVPAFAYPETTRTVQATSYFRGSNENELLLTDTISNTRVFAGGGDDHIVLSRWNIAADGGAGDDVFVGKATSSQMTGGEGADVFLFDMEAYAPLKDWDDQMGIIRDFAPGEDRIGFLNAGLSNFAEIESAMVQNGMNVEIAIQGRILTIENVTIADLGAGMFII